MDTSLFFLIYILKAQAKRIQNLKKKKKKKKKPRMKER